MRECAVGFGHAVGFFALLDGRNHDCLPHRAVRRRDGQSSSFSLRPRAALISQRMASAWRRSERTIDGNLIGGTTNAARTHFNVRSNVVERLMEQREPALTSPWLRLQTAHRKRSFRRRTSCREA
ncbi:hypothetical protein Ddc_22293 [Ditylenchus destructor]|nr:hypothetical protein Ddc_22293 [Ditylenchus destructor]